MATYTQDQLELYFQHINYSGSFQHFLEPLQFLSELMKHHLSRVPFDSTALHYSPHRLVSLSPEDLFQKIVINSRGGYCMEVNTFFAAVLRSLGFAVVSAGGRVKHERWNHMVNIVTINEKKYLVDVGFGSEEPTQPVPLEHGYGFTNIAPRRCRLELKHLPQHSGTARASDAQRVWVCSAEKTDKTHAGWEELYSFTEVEFFPEDFEVMNYFVMTRPQSYFVQTVLAYRAVMDEDTGDLVGELTLHKDHVKRWTGKGDKSEVLEVLKTEEDRVKALEEYFLIRLMSKEKEAIRGLASELKG